MVFDRMPTDPAFVGIPTFLKLPWVQTPEQLAAERPDVVIVGAPFDMGVTNRPGARFGPRAIRQASNLGRGIYHLGLEVQPLRDAARLRLRRRLDRAERHRALA